MKNDYAPPQQVIDAWKKDCRCCPGCSPHPCDGVSAGGMCDDLDCDCDRHDDEDLQDFDDECHMGADGFCSAAGSKYCDWDCPNAGCLPPTHGSTPFAPNAANPSRKFTPLSCTPPGHEDINQARSGAASADLDNSKPAYQPLNEPSSCAKPTLTQQELDDLRMNLYRLQLISLQSLRQGLISRDLYNRTLRDISDSRWVLKQIAPEK